MTPEEITPMDRLKKFFGFQPSQMSREYEKRNAERLGQYGWLQGKTRIVNRIANKQMELAKASTEKDKDQINEDIDELYEDLVKYVTAAGKTPDRDFWRGVQKGIDNHLINADLPDYPLKESDVVEYDILELLYERRD
jgi:hypothetical protein